MLYLDAIRRIEAVPDASLYPWSVPSLRSIDHLAFTSPITLLAGDNGSGKSTLLEGMAAGMRCHAIGDVADMRGDAYLPHARTVASGFRFLRKRSPRVRLFLRAEDVLGYIRQDNHDKFEDALFAQGRLGATETAGPDADPELYQRIVSSNAIDTRSHGEGFLDLFASRLHGGGLYFLDEPESPLSPTGQVALATLVREAADDGAQLIIATHSPVLLAIPEATILYFDAEGVRPMLFDELPSIQFLRRFLAKPTAYLDDPA